MAKVLIYDRPTPDAAMTWYGCYTPEAMPESNVSDIKVDGVEFRVKHWPNGDQMWVHPGALPESFMVSAAFIGKEDVTDGA